MKELTVTLKANGQTEEFLLDWLKEKEDEGRIMEKLGTFTNDLGFCSFQRKKLNEIRNREEQSIHKLNMR